MNNYEVVMPVWNGGSMVLEAIASIKGQTLPPQRIILVDDGSTDGTAQRVQAAAPDVILISQKNRGPGSALDAGVAVCTSPYIAFLDHDDLWLPRKAEAQMQRMSLSDSPDAVCGGVVNRWTRDGSVIREEPMGAARVLGASLLKIDFLRSAGPFSIGGGPHGIVSWWSNAESLNPQVAWDEEIVLIRRIHGANSTLGHNKKQSDSDLFQRLRDKISAKRSQQP